jgi:hypothetical protein
VPRLTLKLSSLKKGVPHVKQSESAFPVRYALNALNTPSHMMSASESGAVYPSGNVVDLSAVQRNLALTYVHFGDYRPVSQHRKVGLL